MVMEAANVRLTIGGVEVPVLSASWTPRPLQVRVRPAMPSYSFSWSARIPTNRRFKGRGREAFRRRQNYRTCRSLGLLP